MGYTVTTISDAVKAHFSNQYNIDLVKTKSNRALFIDGLKVVDSKVTSASYGIVEYLFISYAADLILARPDFVSGLGVNRNLPNIGTQLQRVFGYNDSCTMNNRTKSLISSKFGYELSIDIMDNTLVAEILKEGKPVIGMEHKFNKPVRDLGRAPFRRGYKELTTDAWLYILQQLPDLEKGTKVSAIPETQEEKLEAIKNVIDNDEDITKKLSTMRGILLRKYK